MKPKDVGRCPKCRYFYMGTVKSDPFASGFQCASPKHPKENETYDTPCTLADAKDCEYA